MKNTTILIVDDESLMRDFLNETLTRKGFTVTTAYNGESAIEELKKLEFDLVISDIRMPDISGIDILKMVKENTPDTEVIMMTAYGTIENAVEAMKYGAFDYITKPFSADAIEIAIDKMLNFQNLLKENRLLKKEIKSTRGFDAIIGKSFNVFHMLLIKLG